MNLKNLSAATIAIITSLFIFSCSGGNMPKEKVSFPSIKDVPAEKWKELSQKKIYFGHQSVGFNIIDIAKIESTYPDGSRCSFTMDGKTYYSMVPEYTSDGGHLNETGRKKVAEQFLILPANL
jgi:hypothetical protein